MIRKILGSVWGKLRKIVRDLKSARYTRAVRKQAASCGEHLKVNGRSRVTGKTYLSDHVNFNGMEIEGRGTVRIGRYFHSGRGCLLITQNHNYDEGTEIPYDSSYICRDIVIDDFVWLGDRVIVLGGSHIGEGAVIQAGSVVCGEIPACAVAGGHPARVFKFRDKEHFYQLKEQGKFH